VTGQRNNPVISVVLPVYNCAEYVGEAVQSILDQTFSPFEFIIIDDGSTDRTPAVLKEFRDPRIQILSQENRGLTATLNRGLELARGRYIARQDADDISLRDRFIKQITFLDAHPSCALVGSWADIWLEREKTGRAHHHPSENAELQFELLFNNPFVHSSVMLRKTALEQVGVYASDSCPQTGDFELWSRIARQNEIANIPEVLQIYREVRGSVSRDSRTPIVDQLVKLSAGNLAWASGSDPGNPDVINLAAMVHSARNHIIGRPSFTKMRGILRRAVQRIAPEEHRARLQRKADRRINGLQIRYAVRGLFKEQRVRL
jgi:glycosyltransferase involved in cell wall biosynthesis